MWRETAGTDGKDITPEDLRKVWGGMSASWLVCLTSGVHAGATFLSNRSLAG